MGGGMIFGNKNRAHFKTWLLLLVLLFPSCFANTSLSIVFIVDNSASNSMDKTDQLGLRFNAISKSIEEIKRVTPNTKVGLVLFGSRLWFYKPDNPELFISVPSDQYHDGDGCYIPPLELDKQYTGTYKTEGGDSVNYSKSGLELLNLYLETREDDSGSKVTKYIPTHRPKVAPWTKVWHKNGLTNITVAFEAANQAHLYQSTRTNKNSHVNIFLSDGLATTGGESQAGMNNYIKGTNTPTTFTVNYNPFSPGSSDTLLEMTNNIKNNAYSNSNMYSAFWKTNAKSIEATLKDSILPIIFNDVIQKALQIKFPSGGEELVGGGNAKITWNSELEEDSIKIEFTSDSMKTWTVIKEHCHDLGEYEWEIPCIVSQGCKVRISSIFNPEISDESDTYFTINNNAITVTSPNGGEKLFKGSEHIIRWETAIDLSTVKLEYTKDSAKTWKPIAVFVPDTGAFTWRIPDVSGEYCKVRITSNDNAQVLDESDTFFQILNGSLLIEKPNGGDTLYMGQDENITWQTSGEIGDSKLEYSLDNGGTWHLIESATPNDGGYTWTIPDTTSTTCKVRVESNIYSAINDESDSSFVILKPSISVTSPNWGEVWQGFDLREITWDSKGITGTVTLSYSIGDSLSWVIADSAVPNSGIYNWRVPNNASEKCWVKISHNKYPSIYDINDYPFIIEASNLDEVSITADPIAATLFKQDSLKLTVTAVGQEPITYQWQKNGVSIAGATSALFMVPSLSATDSGAYRCIATNAFGSDTSSSATIALKDEYIRIIYPNGGEGLNHLSPVDVKWVSDIRGYNVSIEYSIDSGNTWEYLAEQTEDDGEFQWNIEPTITGKQSFLRIASRQNGFIADLSDSSFLINIDDAIVVTDSNSQSDKLLIYPNPVSVHSNEVFIAVPSTLSGTAELTICDNLGATLDFQRFECKDGATLSWDLRNKSGLKVTSGSYVALLKGIDSQGRTSRYKVLFGVEE